MGNFNLGGGGGAALPIVRRCPVGYVTITLEFGSTLLVASSVIPVIAALSDFHFSMKSDAQN